ncbi:MAG: prepilin-type N-terminal cleavage/methylation domain-containing protein [Kiritimatiellae bacterium]|nr:prepilin-type N-terminal cleavage/methylation domain-containing protein [Kiritimatiellia bacterium]
MRKNGFTLLEILVVIVVIGILATLVAGSATFAMRSARDKRVKISCTDLQTAIYRYRAEYNEWPGGKAPKDLKDKYKRVVGGIWSGDDNKDVFSMLRADSDDNPDHIRFIDETAYFTTTSGGKEAQKLSETDASTKRPLVFLSRSGHVVDEDGRYFYYRVTINYEDETVVVDSPGFDAEDEED